VYCPADEDDLVRMLPAIWRSPAPAYVRINHKKGNYSHTPYEAGRAEVVARGNDVTLFVYGFLFGNALRAKALLEESGLSVGLINMRSLKPVDEEVIVAAALESGRLVTIEDHLQTGGLYSIVAEVLLKRRMTADVLSLSLGERWFKPGLLDQVLETEGFTPEKIAERIKNANSFTYAQ
jgi:transketolase